MVASSVRRTPPTKTHSPAKGRKSPRKESDALLYPPSTGNFPSRSATPKNTRYSHKLPTVEQRKGNGRMTGRSLIMWNRPRMAEKLLLHMMYECARHKLQLPMDAIAHRLHPGSSGAAVVQHLNRIRRELIAEGHLVPPPTQRAGTSSNIDPSIRGFVRQDMDGEDVETTRTVRFDEPYCDPKFSLPGNFDLDNKEEADRVDSLIAGNIVDETPSPPVSDAGSSLPYTTPTRQPQKRARCDSKTETTISQCMDAGSSFASDMKQEESNVGQRNSSYDDLFGLTPRYEAENLSRMDGPYFPQAMSPAQSFDHAAPLSNWPHHYRQGAMANEEEANGDYRLAETRNWTIKFACADSQPRAEPAHQFGLDEQRSIFPPSFHMGQMPASFGAYASVGVDPNILQSEPSRDSASPVPTEPSVPCTRGDESTRGVLALEATPFQVDALLSSDAAGHNQ